FYDKGAGGVCQVSFLFLRATTLSWWTKITTAAEPKLLHTTPFPFPLKLKSIYLTLETLK
ncbi:hypothetical protein, partial [Wolbachia pipientis]|uniref:hypothetical protein n=1 Tax=Wolbachia pipientis TaxID=955 RepID=UPI001C70D974